MAQSTCRRCGDPTAHFNRHYCSFGCELIDQHTVAPNGCWEWQGSFSPEGYARIGPAHYGHRMAYEVFVGPIPDGLTIDHLCRNTRCVNPEHLEPVTHRENFLRAIRLRPPITACRAFGHPYTAENTYRNRNGRLICLTCKRLRYYAFMERTHGPPKSYNRAKDRPVWRASKGH